MRINREDFLKRLESISSGLAQREVIEQSACFVFDSGRIITFNDEVSASVESPVNFKGAVPSEPLLNLLSKLKEDELEVSIDDKEILFKGKGRRAAVRLESTIALPLESIEEQEESDWMKLDPDFGNAIGIVYSCASNDDSQFVRTCVHITSEFVEACDDYQLARYPIKTGAPESCLIRKSAIVSIMGLVMTEVAYTPVWIHFRNADGLIVRFRRWVEDYEDMTNHFSVDGTLTTLPAGLADAVIKADVFSSDMEYSQVKVSLKLGKIRIRGEGPSGWYEELQKLKYDGPPISFMISPQLLLEVTKRANDCVIGPGSIKVDAGKFVFVAALAEVQSDA